MAKSNYDFSGWATRNDLKCADGRTIRKDAFKDNDGQTVPLVWNHQHDDAGNVLGHALLENRENGVYAYCSFNDTENGRNARTMVQHGDITSLSIYANHLKQNGGDVIHGAIREVSLVLAGANPGAFIDAVMAHSEDSEVDGIIYSGEEFELEHAMKENKEAAAEEKAPAEEKPETKEEEPKVAENKEKTVQDVVDSMSEEQKNVMYALIGMAVEDAKKGGNDKGEEDVKHNAFENETNEDVLTHSDMVEIVSDAKRYGSLKESVLAHGITDIEYLFPDAKNLTNEPGFITRQPDAWVDVVMGGVKHTPFSRVKMMFANLTEDEARAKGYTKGKLKKEEVFSLLKRSVDPTTIYKTQKIDRDDVVDITDFDVVAWIKKEMRMMLDEEIARAILFGDGRLTSSDDHIDATKIIPICSDAALYNVVKVVTPASGETAEHALIKAAVMAQDDYQGSGNLTFFAPAASITGMLLMEDAQGHRLYKDVNELALALNVSKIVKVPANIVPANVLGVMVDLKDYNVGADKGGAVNMFDDFDIDYNKQKYLIETRCSGALVKPYSAITFKSAE